jgi:hypothetical protein
VTDPDDKYDDDIEWWVGTDPLAACPRVLPDPANGIAGHDAWVLDNDIDRELSVTGDVWQYVGKIGAKVADNPALRRLDVDKDGEISVTGDVWEYVGKIGRKCTP